MAGTYHGLFYGVKHTEHLSPHKCVMRWHLVTHVVQASLKKFMEQKSETNYLKNQTSLINKKKKTATAKWLVNIKPQASTRELVLGILKGNGLMVIISISAQQKLCLCSDSFYFILH